MPENINKHQCLGCCLKHISSALVIAGELQTGYDNSEYHIYLLGNLAEAQEQVALTHPALANRIRNLRLKFFGSGATARLGPGARLDLLLVAENLRQAIVAEAGNSVQSITPQTKCKCHAKKGEK